MSIANVSWLRDEVFVTETRSQVCFQSLKAWWRETTDIVILNSPLLNRATGNAFRCIALCSLTFVTFTQSDRLLTRTAKEFSEVTKVTATAVLVLLVIGSVASFLATVWRRRETVRWSWFYCFCLVSAVSLQFLTSRMSLSDEAQFLYIAAVLCHCNFHPVPLLLVIGSMLFQMYAKEEGQLIGLFTSIDTVWSTSMLLLMFCAFTQDFTVRVKAISTGMILPREGGQPHDSPLSGRSARSICWLMVLSIWLAWGALMIEKARNKTEAGHYEYLFQNRLPICTWLVPLLLFTSIVALWLGRTGGRCAMWQADLTMLVCSCTPAAMIFADLLLIPGIGSDKPEPVRIEFVLQFQCRVQAMAFTAEQLLVQAGCHPIVCPGPCVLLALQVVASYLFSQGSWYSELEHHDLGYSLTLSCIVWIGTTVNYVTRYRAISEGLERAKENADSTHSLLYSILNPTHSGVELQPLGQPAITGGPAVAVAVVRHAERADAAHALDDWGCSKDPIPEQLASWDL